MFDAIWFLFCAGPWFIVVYGAGKVCETLGRDLAKRLTQ